MRIPAWWRWPTGVALACLTFPLSDLVPAPGVDTSWRAGLALAPGQGLHFGRDIVFTYGPLGFLEGQSMVVVRSTVAALAFAVVLQVILCRVLLHAMRELPALLAIVVAYVIAAAAFTSAELALTVVLALVLSTLLETDEPPRWFAATGGAAAAILLLIKPDVGMLALALCAIAVAFCSSLPLRAFVELASSFVVVFAACWLATGNALGDVTPWLRASVQFASGYTGAMALDDPIQHQELVQALLLLLVVSVLLWRVAAGRPRGRRVGLALAWSLGAFALFKEGFVRHDGDVTIFCTAVVAATLARSRGGMRFIAAAIAVVAALASFGAHQLPASTLFDYGDHLDGAVSELKLVADTTARNEMLDRTRATMQRNLRIPASVVADLRSHTVDVQPTETSIVWTLGLHWRPEPVFQSYAVETPALDRLNADFLASSRAPERVLRFNPLLSIDSRNAAFDAPNAFLALVCNYRATFASRTAEVFARVADRCGSARSIGSETIAAGKDLRVPRAGPRDLVYARISVPQPLVERLRDVVWKPASSPTIRLDGVAFRLVTATASGPLLLRMPASAAFPKNGLRDTDVTRISVSDVPSPVRVEFYAEPISAARAR